MLNDTEKTASAALPADGRDSKVLNPALNKVENAVILAAGRSRGPRSTLYSPPKALLEVNGVTLIERLIGQLREAGIEDVSLVVGYRKEMFLYLEEKCGVELIGNPYYDRGNVYSLYLARKKLSSTYVCPCDYYFRENPFALEEGTAFHHTAMLESPGSKFVIEKNKRGRITGLRPSTGEPGECIHGISYFDPLFSTMFTEFLEAEIDGYRTDSLFWEEFFARHIADLDMYTRQIDTTAALELDAIEDLKGLDRLFVDSLSSEIADGICGALGCERADISEVEVLEAGHSNITFKVSVGDGLYVYRYPGTSGKNIVDRKRETIANWLAHRLGIDRTLLSISESGQKISRFVEGAHPLNPASDEEIGQLAQLVRRLHLSEEGRALEKECAFDPMAEADRLLGLASAGRGDLYETFADVRDEVRTIDAELKKDNFDKAMCHCNLNSNNCLVTEEGFDLIDWEFSGFCDIAYDFPFLGDYAFREGDLLRYLKAYYNRDPDEREWRHWLCYRAVHYWYYTCWAMYKESLEEDAGNLLLVFYHCCCDAIEASRRYLKLSNVGKEEGR